MDWDEQNQHPEWGIPKYFKPRDPSAALLHIQWESHWQNYSLDGRLVADGRGAFPKEIQAGFEEIDRTQAVQLMEQGEPSLKTRGLTNPQAPVEIRQGAPGPEGIGGWLILPMIGLLLTSLFSIIWMSTDAASALQPDVWPGIPVSGRGLVTFEIFVNLVSIVTPLVLLAILFMKRRVLPKLMISFYVFVFLAVLIDSIGILVIGPDLIPDPSVRAEAGWSIQTVAVDIGRTLAMCAIWIPYFLVSRRVKNTFVEPRPLPTSLPTATLMEPVSSLDDQAAVTGLHGEAAAGPSSTATSNRSHTTRNWLTGASVVIILAVVAVLIWNCASPGSPGTGSGADSTSGTATFADTEFGFSFDYPASWRASQESAYPDDTSDSVANVFDPFGAGDGTYSFTFAEVAVYMMTQSADAALFADLQAGFEQTMASNEESIPSFVLLEPVTETTFGGLEALTVTYESEIDGVPTTVTEYLVPIDRALYSVIFQSTSEEWEMNQSKFQTIADSFEPGT